MNRYGKPMSRIMILTTFLSSSVIFSEEYGKQKTIELSGQASIAYSNNTNPRMASESFYLGLQPTASYFVADSWFIGTGIQANISYSSVVSGWATYGDYSLLGVKHLIYQRT